MRIQKIDLEEIFNSYKNDLGHFFYVLLLYQKYAKNNQYIVSFDILFKIYDIARVANSLNQTEKIEFVFFCEKSVTPFHDVGLSENRKKYYDSISKKFHKRIEEKKLEAEGDKDIFYSMLKIYAEADPDKNGLIENSNIAQIYIISQIFNKSPIDASLFIDNTYYGKNKENFKYVFFKQLIRSFRKFEEGNKECSFEDT